MAGDPPEKLEEAAGVSNYHCSCNLDPDEQIMPRMTRALLHSLPNIYDKARKAHCKNGISVRVMTSARELCLLHGYPMRHRLQSIG